MPDDSQSQPWYAKGVRFKCEGAKCGDCCSGAWGTGYVWVTVEEMQRLADQVGLRLEQFTRKYVRQVGDRYSLIEKPNKDCIFYVADMGCSVYDARPSQCRSYPFWPEIMQDRSTWREEGKDCPGIDAGGKDDVVSAEEIARQLRLKGR